jgi:ribosome-binding protein aMBF1 (putative translation factor)
MTKKFSILRDDMSPEARADISHRVEEALEEMLLHELRHVRGLSQKELAETLHVQQPAVAKMERRTDMYISTLRSHIEAMGGISFGLPTVCRRAGCIFHLHPS